MDLESGLDPMFLVDSEWNNSESDSQLGHSLSTLNMIILNDRLMSEAVQTEHSYFTGSGRHGGMENAAAAAAAAGFSLVDDDSGDSHSYNGKFLP